MTHSVFGTDGIRKRLLLPYGISVYDAATLSTPALIKLVEQNEHIHGGIMISASHNPAHDNGIKYIDHTGKKLDLPLMVMETGSLQ